MDIGDLTGRVAIEDQMSSALMILTSRVEQFADKFNDSFGGLTLAVGAAVAGITAMTAAVTALAVKGSDINDVTTTFNHFTEAAGGSAAVLEAMRLGTHGTIDDFKLMGDASRILSAGVKLNAEDFNTLTQSAFVLQNRGLGTTAEMLDLVSSAMVTGRTRQLAMKLGVIDNTNALQDYANAHGLAVSALTKTQTAEANRLTVLGMLNAAVKDAGTQQLDFAERLDAAKTSVSNWVDELASAVASSPHVAAAFTSVTQAISGFGDSQEFLKTIVGWVDRFADAVTTYGPPVIDAFRSIKNWISQIVTTVMGAWNSIPDWLKNIARDGAIAAAAMVLAGKGLGSINDALRVLETHQDVSKDFTSTWGSSATLTVNLIKIAESFKNLPDVVTKTGVAFTAGRVALNTWAEGAGLAAGAAAPLFAQLATGGVIAAGLAATIAIGNQAWKLWTEHEERVAAAARQTAVDHVQLDRINQALGTSYTTVDEAVKNYRTHLDEVRPKIAALSEEQRLAADMAKAHEEKVGALVNTLITAAANVDLTTEAFNRLSGAQKITLGAQEAIIPLLDAMIAKGIALTAEEKAYYETVIVSNHNITAAGEATLALNKVRLSDIQALQAQGLSEKEIAERLNTTVTALQAYRTELTSLQTLRRQVADLELQTGGSSVELAKKQHEDEFNDAVANLDKTSSAYSTFYDQLAKRRQLEDDAIGSSWSEIEKTSRSALGAMADAAEKDLGRMIASGDFNRDKIEQQRDKMYELRDAVHNFGIVAVPAVKAVQDGWVNLNSTIEAGTQTIKTYFGEVISSSEAAIDQFGNLTTKVAELKRMMGGSQAVTAQNFQDTLNNYETGVHGGSGGLVVEHGLASSARAWELAKKGYSFQEIIDELIKGQPVSPVPIGPPIPGFETGSSKTSAGPLASPPPPAATTGASAGLATQNGGGVTPWVHQQYYTGPAGRQVLFQPGSIVIQYPIMTDAKAKAEVGQMLGDIFVERFNQLGER